MSDLVTYRSFVSSKLTACPPVGITTDVDLNPALFPFQADVVRWALRRGRSAIFADCGMGKTLMQLEWARHIPGKVLILAPLAVGRQTEREGARFGIEATYSRAGSKGEITIANYEMLPHFDPEEFTGIVLDESSILKAYSGKTRTAIIEAFQRTPYRLACTATPAPNDFMELGNHSEFLGIMTRTEMLSMYFTHDGGETQSWRLKGHAESPFWRWLASWAVMLRRPSDLGYSDEGFSLPPLTFKEHVVSGDTDVAQAAGFLFAMEALTLQEQRASRRATMQARVETTAALVGDEAKPWVVWCELNDEGEMLARSISGAIDVSGADPIEVKETLISWFRGDVCICRNPIVSDKLAAWQKGRKDTGSGTTKSTEISGWQRALSTSPITGQRRNDTFESGYRPMASGSSSTALIPPSDGTPEVESSMPPMSPDESKHGNRRRGGRKPTSSEGSPSGFGNTASPQISTGQSLPRREEGARSAGALTQARPCRSNGRSQGGAGSISTTATAPEPCAGFSAPHATSESGSSPMMQSVSSGQPCTCGHLSGRRILVSKSSIFGYGLNLQCCSDVAFVGATHSYEQTYQAIRRCWRFGQTRPVTVHSVRADTDSAVTANLKRKERDAAKMAEAMLEHMRDIQSNEVRGSVRQFTAHNPTASIIVPSWLASEAA